MRLLRTLPFLLCAAPLTAQTALIADATVRTAPGGNVVALLKEGTTVTVGAARNGSVYITFSGWLDGTRLGGARDTFPAHLTGDIAMRLRSAPSMKGVILGEVRPNAGLFTDGKRTSWANVRRGGWVDAKALPATATPTAKAKAPPAAASAKPAAPTPVKPATKPVAKPMAKNPPPAPVVEEKAAPDTASAIELLPDGAMRVARNTVVRNAPNGAAVGQIGGGTYVIPLARSRGWVRVRTEVWVHERDVVPADSTFGASLSAADLRADPEGTRGKTVRWEVQVLALQYADPLRRDLAIDEPYFLAKGPGSEDQLLYLAIPPSLLAEARATQSLTRLLVTARVRTGRSQPVGIPILDLLSFARQ
jgi:hypothetical protein